MLRCNRLNTTNMLATTSTTTTTFNSSSATETAATDLVFNDSDISMSLTMDDCCCGLSDCPTLQSWTRTVQKLETDARLAAGMFSILLVASMSLLTPIYVHYTRNWAKFTAET